MAEIYGYKYGPTSTSNVPSSLFFTVLYSAQYEELLHRLQNFGNYFCFNSPQNSPKCLQAHPPGTTNHRPCRSTRKAPAAAPIHGLIRNPFQPTCPQGRFCICLANPPLPPIASPNRRKARLATFPEIVSWSPTLSLPLGKAPAVLLRHTLQNACSLDPKTNLSRESRITRTKLRFLSALNHLSLMRMNTTKFLAPLLGRLLTGQVLSATYRPKTSIRKPSLADGGLVGVAIVIVVLPLVRFHKRLHKLNLTLVAGFASLE